MKEKNKTMRMVNKRKPEEQPQKVSALRRISNAIFILPRAINRRIRIKITTKTTAMYGILFLLVVTIIAVFVTENLRITIRDREKAALNAVAPHIAALIQADLQEQGVSGLAERLESFEYGIEVKDEAGTVLAENARFGSKAANRLYDLETEVSVTADGETYTVHFRKNIESEMQTVKTLRITFSITVPVGLVVMLALGSLASATMLNPIKEMNRTIKSISAESLETRIEADTSQDELNELKDLLNQMLDELETSFLEQTRFVSDASHELRTPLAVIQGYANLLKRWGKSDPKVLDEAIEAIGKESDNMKNMVDKLLFLAKADTLTVKREPFILSEVVEEIVKETRLIAKDNGIEEIYTDRIEPVEYTGDRDLIKQAVRIFVDNAVKYTDDSGVIRVGCYLDTENEEAVIKIVDNGIGIAAVDLPHIFERFYRSDTSRNRNKGSTGLGLSIAKWIVDSHNGEIVIESTETVGTTVYLRLPIGSAAAG